MEIHKFVPALSISTTARKGLWSKTFAVLFIAVACRADTLYTYTGGGALAGTSFSDISIGGHISEGPFYVPTTAGHLILFGNDDGVINSFALNGEDLILSTNCCLDYDIFPTIPFDPGNGTYTSGSGSSLVISDYVATPVPEPSTLFLVGIGAAIALLVGSSRRAGSRFARAAIAAPLFRRYQ